MQTWKQVREDLQIGDARLLHQSVFDEGRRTYRHGDEVHKIALADHGRVESLKAEAETLRRCVGIKGLPALHSFSERAGYSVLTLGWIDGADVATKRPGLIQSIRVSLRVLMLLVRISLRGVVHNDLRRENVFVSSRRDVYLLDFDQAGQASRFAALLRNLTGRGPAPSRSEFSYPNLVLRLVAGALPAGIKRRVATPDQAPSRSNQVIDLPDVDETALREAWDVAARAKASSPGVEIAYYSLNLGGAHLPGERPWEDRWEHLQDITDFEKKRILELGCNMGLLSAFLRKLRHAGAALAVDVDPEIISAASLVSRALKVDIEHRVIDLDGSDDWETSFLKFEPDIVFALNVLNWVQDKQRLLQFLGRAPEVIFEGHDATEVEIMRLEELGFDVRFVTLTERGRPLLHASRA